VGTTLIVVQDSRVGIERNELHTWQPLGTAHIDVQGGGHVCGGVGGGGGGTDGRKGLQTRQPVGAILIDVRSSGAVEREEGTADTTTHGLLPSRCVG
jgi:hypothetical protein